MRDTILIAPDKFKGSLTATQAAEIIAGALHDSGCTMHTLICPMADGGEGTPHTLSGTPVIVSHEHIGPQSFPHTPVMMRSTHPLGEELLRHTESQQLYVALGGTATTDGGAGLLQALGAHFFDTANHLITHHITPADLPTLNKIDLTPIPIESWSRRLTILYDVKATLTGPGLSSLDFAEQKGATQTEIETIKQGLDNLRKLTHSHNTSPCDGAAGGLGFALSTVLRSPCRSGALEILNSYKIDWSRTALVISGEGSIDRQTTGGKVVAQLQSHAHSHNIPFIAIGGYVEPTMRTRNTISCINHKTDYDPRLAATRLRTAILTALRHHIPTTTPIHLTNSNPH